MEEDSFIAQINDYKSVVKENLDDFIDFLYSKKVINELNYYDVWHKKEHDRISELFNIIHSNGTLETVLDYLKDKYPNREKELKEERDLRECFVRGGFPELPPNYVSRKTLVGDLRTELQDLKWEKKLVIHGMMGYGKSSLIIDVLKDDKVRQYFNNHLFWINLGDCHVKENAWLPMWRLYTAACSVLKRKISHCTDDVELLKGCLQDIFLDRRLDKSLIILDDISNEEILTLFDIKCRTVVTTQNKKIFKGQNVTYLEVTTGFSVTESLELFKKSLKITHDLPVAAEEIHNICQGHPMLISLIGSYLSEYMEEVRAEKDEIWSYIKELFLKGNYRLNECDNRMDISQIIEQCVEKLLTDNVKDFYHDLAIFEQDVNIPPEVLQILWNKRPFEVKNMMNTFAEKSLIVTFFHNDLKSYIYGIHEIYLNYLKKVTASQKKDLHRKLLAGYDRVTNGDYTKLPNDNYTLQFIGYHLYHGERFDKFQIYLDLKFLELKLKSAGKLDVLRDMHKYQRYITRDESCLIEKLAQYKDFISRCGGNLYSYDKSDIIQYALRENKDSCVFKDALSIAKKSSHLYFQLQKPSQELDYSQIINIRDDITSACFVDSPQHILIGTTNGKIKLFYEQSVNEISNFTGHIGAITNLIVSPDKRYFLSVSTDGTVLLWKFAADSSRNSWDFSTESFPISPKNKQPFWKDIHTADRGKIFPCKKFKVTENEDYLISAAFCDKFPDTFRIATGSFKGNVIIWDARTETPLYRTGPRGYSAPSVLYMENHDEECIIFACQEFIFKYKVIDDNLVYISNLHNTEDCNSLFHCDDAFLAVSDKSITRWENHQKRVIFENEAKEKQNICSTLSNDNQYLVVSTNQKTVYIWDIDEERVVREFENKGLAKSLDTFYDEDKSVHILLIGSDKKTLQQCHIQPYEQEPHVNSKPIFTPYWKGKNALTAIPNNEMRLQVFNGYTQISESEPKNSPIICTCFSISGNTVIYGLENGQISSFELKTKIERVLEKPNGSKVTFLRCFDPSGNFRYRHSSSNSNDSLDILDAGTGVIVAVFDNDTVVVHKENEIFAKTISKPVIVHFSKELIIVDSRCNVFTWDVDTGELDRIENRFIFDSVKLGVATYCQTKRIVGIFYGQEIGNFFDMYVLGQDGGMDKKERIVLADEKINVAKFSWDGALLALGMNSGDIVIYSVSHDYKLSTKKTLLLHEDPIQNLIFSPNEPILVSLGEEIAWWNFESFLKSVSRRGRPTSLNIPSITSLFLDMDISYCADFEPVKGTNYLLSFMKLNHKAKYISASNDFNSFLTIDDSGKIYIMEIISRTKS